MILFGVAQKILPTKLLETFKQTFSISSEECGTINCLGPHVQQNNNAILIQQILNTNELKEYNIEKSRKETSNVYLKEVEGDQLRSLANKLKWILSQTCPDISYKVCQVSISHTNAKISDYENTNKHTQT